MMEARLRIGRAGPLTTVQDAGRVGMLAHGISASGPMDALAYLRAGSWAGAADGGAIEFTQAGIDVEVVEGAVRLGWDGGRFGVRVNGNPTAWPGSAMLKAGDRLSITPGEAGVYGYLRFGAELQLLAVLGSRATNLRAQLGGVDGRVLQAGDELVLVGKGVPWAEAVAPQVETGPIRFIWGVHAERFSAEVRQRFAGSVFRVTGAMDRMGVRLADERGVFAGGSILSLVSEPVMPGDIQILGDGTPIVLMRDHQPTGGYPRIGTVISADFDRFAQMRSGSEVEFAPVSLEHAQRLLRSRT
jgi:5-oxoprolinase (ATP-hydrolysing) subunit C